MLCVTSTATAPSFESSKVHSLTRPNIVSVGTIVWLSSELMFFAGLFAMYFTVRCRAPRRLADEAARRRARRSILHSIGYALPFTVILVASSFTCQWGVFAAEKGDVFKLRRWFMLTFFMGLIFVLGQANEYRMQVNDGNTISATGYGSVFFLTTGFHGLHVIGGLIAFILSSLGPRWASSRRRRPPPRSSCRTTGTSSTSSGSACSSSSTSSDDCTPTSRAGPSADRARTFGPRTTSTPMTTGLRPGRLGDRAARPMRRTRRLAMRVPARQRRRRGCRRARRRRGAVVCTRDDGRAYAAVRPLVRGRRHERTASADRTTGTQLYDVSCITCHGANLQGVTDRGPSLIGVGGAAGTSRSAPAACRPPARAPSSTARRRSSPRQQTEALAAYVQSVGGGPPIPTGNLRGRDAEIAEGGELFRLNCASCHGTTFKGAPLSAGKIAPALNDATDKQIYAAMLSGPESMPVFSDNQLTPAQKKAIIAYVQTLKAVQGSGRQRHRPHRPGVRGHRALGGRRRRSDDRDPVDRGEVMSDARDHGATERPAPSPAPTHGDARPCPTPTSCAS